MGFLRFISSALSAQCSMVDCSLNVMAHGDAREGKWRGKCRMEWVASTLYTTSEHGVSSITSADAHTSAASSRLNWRPPADVNGLVRFARKTKSVFCACAITFQKQSNNQLAQNSAVSIQYVVIRRTPVTYCWNFWKRRAGDSTL